MEIQLHLSIGRKPVIRGVPAQSAFQVLAVDGQLPDPSALSSYSSFNCTWLGQTVPSNKGLPSYTGLSSVN